jgi:mRNA interferase RelE/StbE
LKIYEIAFVPSALKEWRALDSGVREQFKKKLEKLRHGPHVPSMRLSGWRNAYRVKLRRAGYRLGYRVFDDRVVILVIVVDRRDKDKVYDVMEARLKHLNDRS